MGNSGGCLRLMTMQSKDIETHCHIPATPDAAHFNDLLLLGFYHLWAFALEKFEWDM